MLMLAQVYGGYTLTQILVWAIILCAVFGIASIAIKQTGVSIPGWAVQIFWICVVAFLAIVAIKFLTSM